MIFGCMILNSASLLLIRSFSAAMLMLVKMWYLAMYLAGDMALYLLLKVVRGDFHSWVPVDGVFGLLVSLGVRVGVKTITDFTGVIHFRGPQSLGGLYWTVNMFLALVASFVSVWVGGGGRMEWTLVLAASGSWVLTFALIVLLMKKQHRGTFWSRQKGKDATIARFTAEDEAVKSSVLNVNEKQWAGIREDVKAWVGGNWWRWEKEKPKWMTDSWIAKVPPDMVPDEAAEAAKLVRASARRRSSFALVAKEEAVGRVQPVS